MTTAQKAILLFLFGLFFAVACFISYSIGRRCAPQPDPVKPQIDTVWRDTTIFVDRPVPEYHYRDTGRVVYIPVTDTLQLHDTTYLYLPIEVKGYSDETYAMEISGVQPNLDWIEVHQKTAYITNTVQDTRRWTFGISAGPGILWTGKEIHGGVGVVAGLQYRF